MKRTGRLRDEGGSDRRRQEERDGQKPEDKTRGGWRRTKDKWKRRDERKDEEEKYIKN